MCDTDFFIEAAKLAASLAFGGLVAAVVSHFANLHRGNREIVLKKLEEFLLVLYDVGKRNRVDDPFIIKLDAQSATIQTRGRGVTAAEQFTKLYLLARIYCTKLLPSIEYLEQADDKLAVTLDEIQMNLLECMQPENPRTTIAKDAKDKLVALYAELERKVFDEIERIRKANPFTHNPFGEEWC